MITSTTLRRAIRLTICLAILSNVHFAHADLSCSPGDMGCAIFTGQRAAVAHLRDDNQSLPEWTTRCVNCHTRTDPSPALHRPLLVATCSMQEAAGAGRPVGTIPLPSVGQSKTA